MVRTRYFAWVCLTIACAACGATRGGPAEGVRTTSPLKVITYTPHPGQPIPAQLVHTSSMKFDVTVHDGYACFVSDGYPLVWPAGYSAHMAGDGSADVHDASGTVVVRANAEYEFNEITVASPGNACAGKGRNVVAILSVTTPGEKGWVPVTSGT